MSVLKRALVRLWFYHLHVHIGVLWLTFSSLKQLILDQTRQNGYQAVPFSVYIHNLIFVFILECSSWKEPLLPCLDIWHQLCDQGASFVCFSLLALRAHSLFMQAALWIWLASGVASGVECMHLLPAVTCKLGKLHLSLPSYTIMCELTPLSTIYTPVLETTYTSWCNYCTPFLTV